MEDPKKSKSEAWMQALLVILVFGPLIWFAWIIAAPLIAVTTIGFTFHAIGNREFKAKEKLFVIAIGAVILGACVLTWSVGGRLPSSGCGMEYGRGGMYRDC